MGEWDFADSLETFYLKVYKSANFSPLLPIFSSICSLLMKDTFNLFFVISVYSWNQLESSHFSDAKPKESDGMGINPLLDIELIVVMRYPMNVIQFVWFFFL